MAKEKLNLERRREIVERVVDDYNATLEFQRPIFQNFVEYYQLYRSVIDEQKQNYKGRANLFVPYVYSTVETIVPRMVGSKPKIESAPREPMDIRYAELNTQLTNYQWDMIEMKRKVKSWVRNGLIYGVGTLKLTWEFKTELENTVKDTPKCEVIDPFDYFKDPEATVDYPGRYDIHKTYRSINELRHNPNYDIPKELEAEVDQDEYQVQREAILGLSKPTNRDVKKCEILEYWGLYDIDDDGVEKECLLVVANRNHLIRAEKNPYKHGQRPFINFHDTDVPSEFWSIGEVEPIMSLQYELNDIRNQRMDNVTLILNRMWLVNKGADVDEEELVSQAGGVIHAGDINGIKDLSTPDVTGSSYNEETLVKADIQQASGVTDFTKGMGNQGGALANETATGIMILTEQGNARFRYKLDNLEDALEKFGKQLNGLNEQFITTDTMIRIVGPKGREWTKIPSKAIKADYDINVEAGSTQPMNKSVRKAEARELLATVAPFAQIAGINLTYFIKYLLQQYDLADINEAFGSIMDPAQLTPEGEQRNPMERLQELQGGQSGAVLGGDVGAQRSVPFQKLAESGESPAPQVERNQRGAQ